MSETLTCESFSQFLGGTFTMSLDSGETMELELIEAATYPNRDEVNGRKPFSLVFRGAMESVVPQRIYRLQHESMGTLEIFLVPIGDVR